MIDSTQVDVTTEIARIPEGYSDCLYQGKRYGLSKRSFNGGRSVKIFANALGDSDFISLNYYVLASGQGLKPCEMPVEKVLDFLKHQQPK